MSEARSRIDPQVKHLALTMVALGIVPALVIGMALKFADGELIVANRSLGPYNLAQLSAGLMSLIMPVLLLLPLGLSLTSSPRHTRFWFLAVCAPWLLFIPSMVAGIAVGGSGAEVPLQALVALSLLSLCFTLWLETLTPLLGKPLVTIFYAAVWAMSGFLAYLTNYVVPYLEIPSLQGVKVLAFILPQLQSGPAALDEAIQGDQSPWLGLLPTLIQIPLLTLWQVLRTRKHLPPKGEKPA